MNMSDGNTVVQDKKRYITRLMGMRCDLGSMANKLNLPLDHGIIFNDMAYPLMSANDYISDKNIVHSGRCTSNMNPENTMSLESLLIPGSKWIKKLIGCDGCKCSPKVIKPWTIINEKHRIDGAPALMMESQALCYYGGTIRITLELEEKAAAQAEQAGAEEAEDEKNILDRLPDSMRDKVDSFTDKYVDAAASSQDAAYLLGAEASSAAVLLAAGIMPAGMAGYGLTSSLSQANFYQNQYQNVPYHAVNDSGMITDPGCLYDYNIGVTTLASADCGCTAMYNVMKHFDLQTSMADIVSYSEKYSMENNMPLGGSLGLTSAVMADYFTQSGLKTKAAVTMGELPGADFCPAHSPEEAVGQTGFLIAGFKESMISPPIFTTGDEYLQNELYRKKVQGTAAVPAVFMYLEN